MKALLSILSLYNYDNSIFDNFILPTDVEKEDVVNNLLLELAELEILYASPVVMKAAIGFWSKKESPVWRKLAETTKLEYNPLNNAYRDETTTNTETRNLTGTNNQTRNLTGTDNETRNLTGTDNETRNLTGTDNETRNLTGTDNETRALSSTTDRVSDTTGATTNNGTDTTKEYVSGFNATVPATLSKQTEQILGSGNSVTGTVETTDYVTDAGTVDKASTDAGTVNKLMTDAGTVNKALTDVGTVNKALTDAGTVNKALTDAGTINNSLSDAGTVTTENAYHLEGSIGIITPQQMIEQQRKVVQFNVTNYIIDSFKTRFCILIY